MNPPMVFARQANIAHGLGCGFKRIQNCLALTSTHSLTAMVGLFDGSRLMIDVTFQVILVHHEDEDVFRVFSLEAQLPALPPNLTDTEFKMVPGVANILTEVVLSWNQPKRRYIIAGSLQPEATEGFERVVATLLQQGWQEERKQTEPLV